MKFLFGGSNRLANASAYQRVFDSPDIKIGTDELLILGRRNDKENAEARLGLVVAKKKLRTAVKRNRFKRKVRESFRLCRHELLGFDLVVIARKGGQDLSDKEFFNELNTSWTRVALRVRKTNLT